MFKDTQSEMAHQMGRGHVSRIENAVRLALDRLGELGPLDSLAARLDSVVRPDGITEYRLDGRPIVRHDQPEFDTYEEGHSKKLVARYGLRVLVDEDGNFLEEPE